MVSVYLVRASDSPFFKAQWLEEGTTRRRTRSLRTADPDEAERLRAELEASLAAGEQRPQRLAWGAFVDRYVRERLGGGSEGGRQNARRDLLRFGRGERPAGPHAVTARMVSSHTARLREDGLAGHTINTHLAHLRAALNWAAEMGFRPDPPPVKAVAAPRRTRIRHLSVGQYPRLLAAMPSPGWGLFLRLAWHTGMRAGELFLLSWAEGDGPWLDLRRGRVVFPAASCKGRRDEWLPLHRVLLAELGRLEREAGRVLDLAPSAHELSKRFCELGRPLGVRTHDVRRGFGTRYAPKVPAHILQRLMRHRKIETTLRYYADLDDSLGAAIDSLP
jgi:integrase